MPTNTAPSSADELIPPMPPDSVIRVTFYSLGLAAVAAVAGLVAWQVGEGTPWPVHTARLILSGLALLLGGWALTQGPTLVKAWAIVSMAALAVAVLGLPTHWDSARLLARVMTGLLVAGTILVMLPLKARLAILSCAALFHFSGIFCAITWPEPSPWLTSQIGNRVYMPYLSFAYLRNAYHFYSPEPGPASLLVFLVEYELDEPELGEENTAKEWIILPRRRDHMVDPLGLTYYRRLSLTEMVSPSIHGLVTAQNLESLDAYNRRLRATIMSSSGTRESIPFDEVDEPRVYQYKIPQAHVTRYLLPSYARHLAMELSGPGRKVVGLKMYRLEHRIMPPSYFSPRANEGRKPDPYHPRTYRCYYYGDYDPTGKLIDPQDEMLYWLIPISPRPGVTLSNDPNQQDYIDYLSRHAGYKFEWERMKP